MVKTSRRQRKSIGRVMHEYKHGELKSGRRRRAGKVKNPRQAIAIALHEAGASRTENSRKNRRNLKRTGREEARGETAQQEAEGKNRVGARGRRQSSTAMRGNGRRGSGKKGRSGKSTRAKAHGRSRSRSSSRSHASHRENQPHM